MDSLSSATVVSFTSEATAEAVTVEIGYVPAKVVAYVYNGANVDIYTWWDQAKFEDIADADGSEDDAIKLTGSTGITTIVDDAISKHTGGTEITTSVDENFRNRFGEIPTAYAAGDARNLKSSAGITLAAAIQVNSGVVVLEAYRLAE